MNYSVFRKDKKNVGDWHSCPVNYLPLRGVRTFDIANPSSIPNEPGIIVLGGGGLGRPEFAPLLQSLLREDRKYRIIAWGVGADTVTQRGSILDGPVDMPNLLSFFDGIDDVGTRIDFDANMHMPANSRWVPCASCLGSRPINLLEALMPA